jgi:MazG family protein
MASEHTPHEPATPGDPRAPILDRSLDLVRFLRARCPWDAAQTPESLEPYLLEEALETAEAISTGDDAALRDELGDLLLNVAFQIVLAEERRAFSGEEVLRHLEAKMRRRHPHVYGDAAERPSWEALKAEERAPGERFDGITERLDPLARAQRMQDRASGVGFDWPDVSGAWAKFLEEVGEVDAHWAAGGVDVEAKDRLEEELGDLLFAAVNVIRLAGSHAAAALRRANAKFARRFEAVESLARERGLTLGEASLEELDRLWDEVKRAERGGDERP